MGMVVTPNLMEVLLTGSNGFLGNIIKANLLKCHLTTLSRSMADVNIDLSVGVPIFDKSFDLVIHSAGLAHVVHESSLEINPFYEINVQGTLHLLEALERSGIPRHFVFISSVSVYGLESGRAITEEAPLLAIDPYGKSKIQAELIVSDWCKKNNVICTILRLPLLVGLNPPGNLGSMIRAIRSNYYFNVAGGLSQKSMVLADDVAASLLKVSEIGGIYNLTDGFHPSFSEISNHIAIQLSKSRPVNMPMWLATIAATFGDIFGNKAPLNTRKLNKITSDLTFDDTKAREVFGWNPTPVLEGFKVLSTDL
jgi:nucleoside-diphosphate-sugar epimerase